MLSREENELICRTGPVTSMGELLRRSFPRVMRETSSRSSTRRVRCIAWRSITSRHQLIWGEVSPPIAMMPTALRMGASGLRSSWASMARNSVK